MASRRFINVEPLIFFYSAGATMYGTLSQAVFAYKQCLERRPMEHEFCRTLGTNEDDLFRQDGANARSLLDDVQASTAQLLILYQLASTLPSVLLALCIGAWCDTYGRKAPLILATSGTAVAIALAVLCVAVDAIPTTAFIFSALIKGCTGQIVLVHLAAFAMISDSVESSDTPTATAYTVRVGVASGLASLGSMMGNLAAGLIMDISHSYAYVYVMACAFVTCSTAYAVFILQETVHWPRQFAKYRLLKASSVKEFECLGSVEEAYTEEHTVPTASGFLGTAVEKMRETIGVFTRKRNGRIRMYLVLSYLAFTLMSTFEPTGVTNLYLKRPPLLITDSQFSYIQTMGTASMVISKLALVSLLKKVCKMSDVSLILVGICGTIIKQSITAFSSATWMIVLANVISGIAAMETVGFRSYFGSIVDKTERGRLYAAVFLMDVLGPLLSAFITNNIFAATLTRFPGFVFLLKTVVAAFIFVLLSWIHIDSQISRGEKVDIGFFKEDSKDPFFECGWNKEYNESSPLLKSSRSHS